MNQTTGVRNSISIMKSSDFPIKKPHFNLPIESIKENNEPNETDIIENNDSISEGSPLGEKDQYSPQELVLNGVDYNYTTNYCYYPNIFDFMPKKAVSEEDDEDEAYLWEKPKELALKEKNSIHDEEKEETEEEKRKKALEKDREPNFFMNGEGFRFARNSMFLMNEQNLIRLFVLNLILYTKGFKRVMLFFLLLNLVAYGLYDYEYRLEIKGEIGEIDNNIVAFYLELICNIFFSFEFLLRSMSIGVICEKYTYLRTGEGLMNFVLLIINWFFLIQNDEHYNSSLLNTILLLKALRIIRVCRLLFVFKDMKLTVVSLINALPSMAQTFYCLVIVLIFYTIWGLHFFKGVEEYRCRDTPDPELINGSLFWPPNEIVEFHCGYWNCPSNLYCGSPYEHNMEFNPQELNLEIFNFGITTFSDFFNALLIVLHFVFLVGWSNFTYMNWRVVDGFFTALFFGSLVIIGFFIMVNLFLASVYDSFMYHTNIRDKSKKIIDQNTLDKDVEKGENFFLNLGNMQSPIKKTPHHKDHDMKVKTISFMPKFTLGNMKKNVGFLSGYKENILSIFEKNYCRRSISLLIIGDIIVLCLDGYPITHDQMVLLHELDFFFFCCFLIEITLKIFASGLNAIKKSFIFLLDFLIIYSNLAVIIYESSIGLNIFEEGTQIGIGIKTLKMVRIFRVLYYTQIFSSLSIIIKSLIKTLSKMKEFFIIMIVLVVVFALMGMQIFSNRARFEETSTGGGIIYDLENGEPPRPNFDDFFNACVSIMLVLYNEEWHISMYQHSKAVGHVSEVFYIFVVFIAQIIMMKLLVALFLNNFIQYIKAEIIDDQQDIMKVLKLGFRKKLLTFANYINTNNKEDEENENKNKTSSRFGMFKMRLMKNILKLSQSIHADEEDLEIKTDPMIPENPISTVIRLALEKPMNPLNNPSNLNPNSDISSRRFIIKPINEKPRNSMIPSMIINHPEFNDSRGYKVFLSNMLKKSLLIFPKNSAFRRFLKRILGHWIFEAFMLLVIFISSLILVIENPFEDPMSFEQVLLSSLDMAVTIIYGIEFLMNALAFGFIWGPDTYLRRSGWNILDFAIFIFSLMGVILSKDQLKINSMKVFRTIRILKMGQKNMGIRVATQALIAALPNILRLLAFAFIFILGFALYGMRYLKGLYFYCTTLDEGLLSSSVKTKIDCFDYGGDWVRYDMHFDTIWAAVSTLFQVATSEGWLMEMYKAVDATNIDQQPEMNNNKYWIVFYLVYFFVGNFLVINMFIAVIGETYLEQKNRASKFHLMTEEQKEWALIKTSIYKLKPKKKKSQVKWKFQEQVIKFRKLKIVKYFYFICIGFNIVILALYYHRQPPEMTMVLDQLNMAMIYIFTIYFLIRILCINSIKHFLKSRNTIISILSLSLTYGSFGINNQDRVLNSLAKATQTIYVYHFLKNLNIIQRIFHTLFFVLPSLANIVSLMMLILYIYTIISMDIFSYMRLQNTVNGYDVDFRTFPKALFSLFRVTTGELWFLIVSDCIREQAPNFACMDVASYADYMKYGLNGCGSSFYYFFFYTYHLFFSLIILNLFIVTILVSYGEVFNAEQRAIDRFQLSKINDLWTHFDPLALGYINYKDFWTLASKIAVEFGVSEKDLLEIKNKKNFINILKIPLYENRKERVFCYKFHDVIVRLAEISVTIKYGVVDLEPSLEKKNEEKKNEEKNEGKDNLNLTKFKKKTADINKNKEIDGFVKTSFHSGHMASIMIIYHKIRKLVKKARKEDDEMVDLGGVNNFLKKLKETIQAEERKEAEEKARLENEKEKASNV